MKLYHYSWVPTTYETVSSTKKIQNTTTVQIRNLYGIHIVPIIRKP